MRLAEKAEEFAVNDFGVGPGDRVWPECDLATLLPFTNCGMRRAVAEMGRMRSATP
jgi:hypothetical protein